MEPIIALIVIAAIVWVVKRRRTDSLQLALRGGIFAMFVLTGVSHFVGMRAELITMVPTWLPHPHLIVTVTGVLELAGAVGMLVRPLVPLAGLGLGVLLVAMFPANVALAQSGAPLPWWDELFPRTLMQLIFLAATLGVTALSVRARREPTAAPRTHRVGHDPDAGPTRRLTA